MLIAYHLVRFIGTMQLFPKKLNIKRIFGILRKLLYETFATEEYEGKVVIRQAVMSVDRYYSYPYESFQSCSRISEVTEIYHTNSVHPNDAGYQQLGDGYFLQAVGLLSVNILL